MRGRPGGRTVDIFRAWYFHARGRGEVYGLKPVKVDHSPVGIKFPITPPPTHTPRLRVNCFNMAGHFYH